MSLPTEISHEEVSGDLIPTQYRERPNIEAFYQTWFDKSQELETDFLDVLYETFFLVAEGNNLNRYGNLFGLRRVEGSLDSEYRERIVKDILKRSSDGSPDRIRQILEATTGITNTQIFEHVNSRTMTGGLYVYGYSPTNAPVLSLDGNEGDLIKVAAPVTTGSCVLGLHTPRFESNNELFIPTELIATREPLYVDGEDFLVNEVDDNIAIRNTNTRVYGLGWEQGLLAEIGTLADQFVVESGSGEEDFIVESSGGEEAFQVEVDGVGNDKGVFLETAQHNLGDLY